MKIFKENLIFIITITIGTIISSLLIGYLVHTMKVQILFPPKDSTFIYYLIFIGVFTYMMIKALIAILGNYNFQISKHFSPFVYLWFDWLKWFIMIGAVTFVAEQTKDQTLFFIKNVSYLVIFIYFIFILLDFIFRPCIFKNIFKKSFEIFTDKNSVRLRPILAICLGILVSISYYIIYFIYNLFIRWNNLMYEFVTKFKP
jgi:hypothetical protein